MPPRAKACSEWCCGCGVELGWGRTTSSPLSASNGGEGLIEDHANESDCSRIGEWDIRSETYGPRRDPIVATAKADDWCGCVAGTMRNAAWSLAYLAPEILGSNTLTPCLGGVNCVLQVRQTANRRHRNGSACRRRPTSCDNPNAQTGGSAEVEHTTKATRANME